MFRQFLLILLLPLSLAQAQSVGGSRTSATLEDAGAMLETDQRITALREILDLSARQEDPELLGILLRSEIAIEAGPHQVIEALDLLAKADAVTDREAFGAVSVALFGAIADLHDGAYLTGDAAIALDEAIKRFEKTAADLGLPKISDMIAAATGDRAASARAEQSVSAIATDAEEARGSQNAGSTGRAAEDEYTERLVDLAVSRLRPITTAVPYLLVREKLAWDKEMWTETTNGLNIVSEAIETGQVDRTAYNRTKERLHVLANRPWRGDAARDLAVKLCRSASGVGRGDWCDDAFDTRPAATPPPASGGACLVFYRSMVGPILAQSDFQSGDEGWRIIDNGKTRPISENGYLSAEDEKAYATYFWSAPAKFLGDKSSAFGGALSFDLRLYENSRASAPRIVVLEGGGVKLALPKGYRRPTVFWHRYNIWFQQCAGWINLATGKPSTSAELLQVLSNLEGLYIRGEYSSSDDDKASLDDVVLWTGK